MKFLKKALSLLLILALLLPCIASVSATHKWGLAIPYNVYFHYPRSYHHLSGDGPQYISLPSASELYVGYDFIGWVESRVEKAQLSELPYVLSSGSSVYAGSEDLDFYALYGKESDSGYAYYSTSIDPVECPFAIYHSLDLENGFAVNLLINKADYEKFDDVDISAEIPVYEGNEHTRSKYLSDSKEDRGQYVCFTITGINATQMNETISFTMDLTKDKESIIVEHQYSIATYAYSMLNHSGTSAALKSVCANLLQYGRWAQVYKSCHTDALVDQKMTSKHRAYLTDLSTVSFDNINTQLDDRPFAPVQWVGKALDLQSSVALNCVIDCDEFNGSLYDLHVLAQYTDSQGKTKLLVGNNRLFRDPYVIGIETIPISELRTPMEVRVMKGDIPVSNTLVYSISSYGNGKTGTLRTLCKALMAYSDSVVAFMAE